MQVDAGKEINVLSAINEKVITRGLKYSLATGNWGEQGKQGIRAGGLCCGGCGDRQCGAFGTRGK